MYRLKVRKHFDAAHFLPDHAGPCAKIHGHRWEIEAEVSALNVGDGGMVVDFQDVKDHLAASIADLDHALLNDLKNFEIAPPTAENVAVLVLARMAEKFPHTTAVTVWESPNASVTIERYNRHDR